MQQVFGLRPLRRRHFIGKALVAGLAASGITSITASALADSLSETDRNFLTPDQIIALLLQGNARFRAGVRQPRDTLAEQRSSANGQYPAAIALSCIDSRAPIEVICDLGIGTTFNARVAGAVVNDDILGSIEYACAVAGAKLAIVIGHTKCGAVKGAIDDVVMGNLTGLIAKIRPAIRDTQYDGDRNARNYAFVDAVALTNVGREVELIRERSPTLRKLEIDGKIKIAGAMYNVTSGLLTIV
jgi:carbonic anhydrase